MTNVNIINMLNLCYEEKGIEFASVQKCKSISQNNNK